MLRGRVRLLIGFMAILALVVAGFFLGGSVPEISLRAERVFHLFDFPVTNTMLATWMTMVILLLLSFRATRRVELVPKGIQNFLEAVVEAALGVVESVAGKQNGRRFFPLIATIFLFIVVANWLGLLPGFGTILIASGAGEKEHHFVPLLRSANTDLNTTLALALVAMGFVEFWGISVHGFFGYGGRFFNVRRILRGDFIFGVMDLFVGVLEAVSEVARTIAFTFRLFGNIFAGEVLLGVVGFLVPLVGVLPFFGLELFVGFIQALVFAMLTLVFATIAVASHEEHQEGGQAH